MDKRLMTVDEFCRAYAVGRTRTYALIKRGAIEAVKSGTRTLITVASADEWASGLPRVGPKGGAARNGAEDQSSDGDEKRAPNTPDDDDDDDAER